MCAGDWRGLKRNQFELTSKHGDLGFWGVVSTCILTGKHNSSYRINVGYADPTCGTTKHPWRLSQFEALSLICRELEVKVIRVSDFNPWKWHVKPTAINYTSYLNSSYHMIWNDHFVTMTWLWLWFWYQILILILIRFSYPFTTKWSLFGDQAMTRRCPIRPPASRWLNGIPTDRPSWMPWSWIWCATSICPTPSKQLGHFWWPGLLN